MPADACSDRMVPGGATLIAAPEDIAGSPRRISTHNETLDQSEIESRARAEEARA